MLTGRLALFLVALTGLVALVAGQNTTFCPQQSVNGTAHESDWCSGSGNTTCLCLNQSFRGQAANDVIRQCFNGNTDNADVMKAQAAVRQFCSAFDASTSVSGTPVIPTTVASSTAASASATTTPAPSSSGVSASSTAPVPSTSFVASATSSAASSTSSTASNGGLRLLPNALGLNVNAAAILLLIVREL